MMNRVFNRLKTLACNSQERFDFFRSHGFYDKMRDEKYLKKMFKVKMGYSLDLSDPKTFSEKLQWLKLYDRKPEYTMMVDKYAVKQFVADKLGKEYVIPTYGVWDTYDDIDFSKLPNQFVLKCTHDSGGIVIVKDKNNMDYTSARKKLNESLARDYYLMGREWPYKDVPRKIICEKYMEDSSTLELRDYKFYCFHGEPLYCQVISDRTTNETIDFFDMQWFHQEFTGLSFPKHPYPHSVNQIQTPISLNNMIRAARILSETIPFVRIDFYEIQGKMYFGEITFFPASGFGVFEPEPINYKMGSLLTLSERF